MRPLLSLLAGILLLGGSVAAQDYLGTWKVVRIFAALPQEVDNGNRMLHTITQSQSVASGTGGVLIPQNLTLNFEAPVTGRTQHVTLFYQDLRLFTLNFQNQPGPPPPADPEPPQLRAWSTDEHAFEVYRILFNDPTQLVFSDQGPPPARFLDIYQLERLK